MILTGSSPSSSWASATWSDQPCALQPAANSSGSSLLACSHSAMRSTGWRQAVDSSAPRAATIWPTTVGSTAAACSQPIRSRHSNALLMKSSECPLSAKARSVAAASRALASTAGDRPAAIAVSSVRSAASPHLRPTLQPALERGRIGHASKRRTFASRRLAVAVRRHAACAVEQGEISFLLWQERQEIGERCEDRQTYAPAVAVLRSEQRHLPHDVGKGYVGRELTMHGLGDDEPEVVGETVRKPLAPVRRGIGMT